jgi:hypothetical protein
LPYRTHHKARFKHHVAEEMMMDSRVVKDMSVANAITKVVNKFNLPL